MPTGMFPNGLEKDPAVLAAIHLAIQAANANFQNMSEEDQMLTLMAQEISFANEFEDKEGVA